MLYILKKQKYDSQKCQFKLIVPKLTKIRSIAEINSIYLLY